MDWTKMLGLPFNQYWHPVCAIARQTPTSTLLWEQNNTCSVLFLPFRFSAVRALSLSRCAYPSARLSVHIVSDGANCCRSCISLPIQLHATLDSMRKKKKMRVGNWGSLYVWENGRRMKKGRRLTKRRCWEGIKEGNKSSPLSHIYGWGGEIRPLEYRL